MTPCASAAASAVSTDATHPCGVATQASPVNKTRRHTNCPYGNNTNKLTVARAGSGAGVVRRSTRGEDVTKGVTKLPRTELHRIAQLALAVVPLARRQDLHGSAPVRVRPVALVLGLEIVADEDVFHPSAVFLVAGRVPRVRDERLETRAPRLLRDRRRERQRGRRGGFRGWTRGRREGRRRARPVVRIRRLLHGARGVELPGEGHVRGRGVRVVQDGCHAVAVAAGVVPGVETLAAFFGDCRRDGAEAR